MTAGIIDRLEEKALHLRRRDEFEQGVQFSESIEPTGEFKPWTLDANEQFVLSAKVEVYFWANKAQHHHARKIATKQLRHTMFADLLGDIAAIERAISDGDKLSAYEAVHSLRLRVVGSD